ncbi:MFS transporter [Agrobacterium tumefaciens]|uniref:MFS transporter n=1 Tax=Agrobacterium tumefaciens TaxID=358 RepID=A0AAJ4TD01_AGRTU|nr:MFS transporter [Agrobacterium tumefaciens]KAA3499216.1 MFS transporter [Agrobacterium tumefaciens]MDR5012331.1 MFS transporter [Agrobacterium tumefaciens]OMP69618.1 MFS transporter [Agrobacterium tumefaciens]QTG16589.1 MFS transporter [Agrobacterium tumefaciens]
MEQTKSFALEKEKTGITVTLALAMLLASLGTSIANIALPALVDAFAAPFLQVQAVVVAYLAAMTVSVVIAGRLGDSRGLKPMLVVGLAVFAIASLLCAIAPNLSLLIGARALQGVGAAFLMTLAMALMRQTANEARVGRAMGLLGTVSALGTALGPSLGGLLIPVAGWRGIFWVQVPLAVLALVLAIRLLPAGPAKAKALSVTLWSVMTRNLVTNLLVNIVVAAVMMTTLVVGPFYLGIALGLTATQVGFVMAVGPVISIFSGVPSGRMVDAWGSGRILAIGLALLAAGSFLLALLPNRIGVTGYVISIIVLTPGYQLFQAANNTAALAEVSKDRRGTVSGLISLSRNIGLIAGASAMGAVFAFGVGMEEFARATASAIASGMRLTFLLAGGMMLVAIGIAIRHSNPIPRP